jgi:hypothetical protein
MQPTEDFLVPFLNSYVFSIAVLYPISLTPRFSEVYGRVCYHNRFSGLLVDSQKPLKRLGARSRVVNTQLKQGVNEKSVDAKLYPNSFSP